MMSACEVFHFEFSNSLLVSQQSACIRMIVQAIPLYIVLRAVFLQLESNMHNFVQLSQIIASYRCNCLHSRHRAVTAERYS